MFSDKIQIMNCEISKRLVLIATFLTLLPNCSFDPKLEDLKLRVTVQDSDENTTGLSNERMPTLSYWNCCRLFVENLDGTRPMQDNLPHIVIKTLGKGEISFTLPEALLINKTVKLRLYCAYKDSPNNLTVESCDWWQDEGVETNRCDLTIGESQRYSVRVPNIGSLPAECTVQ